MMGAAPIAAVEGIPSVPYIGRVAMDAVAISVTSVIAGLPPKGLPVGCGLSNDVRCRNRVTELPELSSTLQVHSAMLASRTLPVNVCQDVKSGAGFGVSTPIFAGSQHGICADLAPGGEGGVNVHL